MSKPYDLDRIQKILDGVETPVDMEEAIMKHVYDCMLSGLSIRDIVMNMKGDIESRTASELRFFLYGIIRAEDFIEDHFEMLMEIDKNTTTH